MSKFSFRKDNSNVKPNVSITDKTCDLLSPPFQLLFAIFYNNTTQNTMPLHSLHHAVPDNLLVDE